MKYCTRTNNTERKGAIQNQRGFRGLKKGFVHEAKLKNSFVHSTKQDRKKVSIFETEWFGTAPFFSSVKSDLKIRTKTLVLVCYSLNIFKAV